MTFALTVLGSSGIYATKQRACSGYLLESGDEKLIIDCGAGTWRNLLEHTDHTGLSGVMLSHRHPDHVADLFQIFHARRYGQREALPQIPLWAPAETLERLVGFAKELDEAFELHAISPGDQVDACGARFTYVSMAHPPDTVGMRIERDGRVIAYSSDTGPAADTGLLAGSADVFVCEATLQDSDEEWEGHLSASQAGTLAAEAGAKKLVLTHLPPGRDAGLSLAEAQRTSGDAQVQLAADGLRVEVEA